MPPLATDLFDYSLPPQLIAQAPAPHRDRSRLLVIDRAKRTLSHHTFSDLPHFLRSGDTLIRNNASVLPARLHAQRPTGGQIECFLLHAEGGDQVWRCLVKPGKKLAVGATFTGPGGEFSGEIIARHPDGSATVRFSTRTGAAIAAVANRLGDIPLPPYITRAPSTPSVNSAQHALDAERYQTIYADHARQVAVAAPTAGLHFTAELLAQLSNQGVAFADLTLHVGLGTFKPLTTPTVEEHVIHRERYEIPVASQQILFPPRTGRRIAVGTTSVRTVEDFLGNHDGPLPTTYCTETGIFIFPPHEFRGIDALITNFHQPRSSLMCLVAAFLSPGTTEGIDWIRAIYAEAIAREYRFFSYGDAMLIL